MITVDTSTLKGLNSDPEEKWFTDEFVELSIEADPGSVK